MSIRDPVEESLRRFFDSCPRDISAVWLFGSVARRQDRSGSDVDVGVLFGTDPEPVFPGPALELESELTLLLRRDVQVVAMNRAPADLVHRILRDGVMVCDRDRSAWIRYVVNKRNEYFDLLPILERCRMERARS